MSLRVIEDPNIRAREKIITIGKAVKSEKEGLDFHGNTVKCGNVS